AEWEVAGLGRSRHDLGASQEQQAAVREICSLVAAGGDAALFECCRRFDGWAPEPGEPLAVGPDRLRSALEGLAVPDREALETAARRIHACHAAPAYADVSGPAGLRLRTRPVARAGLYVPGGRAAYPSTVLMTAIPARVAGVREVVVATPPAADGS